MATEAGLARIQRWMQACILNQGTCAEAIESGAAQAAIPADEARTLVLPSATLSPYQRLDIYREMYLLRLQEALETDYPGLAHFLGADGFMRLVARYVEVYPSRSYTLNRLGDHLPEFVSSLGDLPKPEFCAELARLEYALTLVFDAEETPPLAAEAIAAVDPEAWENAKLKPVAAFRLLEFTYPVSEYLGGVDEENPYPAIRKRPTWVAAYRKNFHVRRLDLKRPAFELLSAIASGERLGEAVMRACAPGRKPAVRESQLFEWFREWMAEGLFHAVETS